MKIEDFWNYVAKGEPTECWPWQRGRTTKGYGKLWLGDVQWYAHQLAFEIVNGTVPDGYHICHTCDNPPCCNPAHLWMGTNHENVLDKIAKDRSNHPRGEAMGANVLTERQVLDIRAEYIPGKVGYKRLAKKYGVHAQTISDIIRRKSWVWL